MVIPSAFRQDFLVRLYQWSSMDTLREAESGFALISRISSAQAKGLVSALEAQRGESSAHLICALVKRFHPIALQALGESLSPEELTLLESLDSGRAEWWKAPKGHGVRGKRLKSLVEEMLPPLLGPTALRTDPGPKMLGFKVNIGDWNLETTIGLARHPFYYHSISRRDEFLESHISINSWMGISSMTEWDLIQPGEEESVVSTMMEACSRFLEAAPGLLRDN